MPKLPVMTAKKLLKVLGKLGFRVDHITGSHFILYNDTNRKRVVVPLHLKDLPKGTLMSILSEADIDKSELARLVKKQRR